ncbi:MAG: RNA 2',3'-cyclic phosphodiesterase [Candidatus Bathyarchaeota archaeon]|nr:RNA 2',3'-cyclic phosphodiesterase [Candidatus Bathyarchaeota archaeon]
MSGTIRSFFAFDIEDHTILNRLAKVQGMLANTGADVKMVKPENIHLTIRFLGDIQTGMVDAIYEEMKQLSFVPFEVELKGLGAFPRLSHPNVVWAGITQGAKELTNVFEQLEPRLRGLGFKPDNKGFSPHLTITRVRTGRNKPLLIKKVQELENYEFGTIKVECLRLKKSDLTPRGPIYSNLREVCGKKV